MPRISSNDYNLDRILVHFDENKITDEMFEEFVSECNTGRYIDNTETLINLKFSNLSGFSNKKSLAIGKTIFRDDLVSLLLYKVIMSLEIPYFLSRLI